jgi:hypothetical protein
MEHLIQPLVLEWHCNLKHRQLHFRLNITRSIFILTSITRRLQKQCFGIFSTDWADAAPNSEGIGSDNNRELTPWSRVLLEQLIVIQKPKNLNFLCVAWLTLQHCP